MGNMILLGLGKPLMCSLTALPTESRNSIVRLISASPFSLAPFLAVVVETATEPRDGIGKHRATIGGPSFLCALIQTTILQFRTS